MQSVNSKLNFLERKVYREILNFLFQCTLFLIFPHFPKYLNSQVRTRKFVKSVFYHPCPLRLASEGYIFLYFFKLLRVLSLRMLIEFSLTCIFQHVWEKFFNLWCSHPSKIIESMNFYSCLSPPLKIPGRIF